MAGNNGQGSNWIRKERRLAIYHRDGFRCVYCGATAEEGHPLSLDHVLARDLGGSNDAENLVTACGTCNSAKTNLSLGDWLDTLRDQGMNVRTLAATIRRHTQTTLDMKEGRRLLALRNS